MPANTALEECVDILRHSRRVVVSTGAGISKESGIPTFRDAPSALWENYDPQQLATREGFRRDPGLVWRWYAERRKIISAARPNAGHIAIAEIERFFERFDLVTQNIDNLHPEAGSSEPIEMHGNIFRYKCFDNDHPIDTLPDDDHVPPRCRCGSLIRPDVVWFGEPLPLQAVELAYKAIESCDAMLVVGTSGQVQPAATFPAIARDAGARVIEVNPEDTPNTVHADVFLRGEAGEILPVVVKRLGENTSTKGRSD